MFLRCVQPPPSPIRARPTGVLTPKATGGMVSKSSVGSDGVGPLWPATGGWTCAHSPGNKCLVGGCSRRPSQQQVSSHHSQPYGMWVLPPPGLSLPRNPAPARPSPGAYSCLLESPYGTRVGGGGPSAMLMCPSLVAWIPFCLCDCGGRKFGEGSRISSRHTRPHIFM